MFYLLKSLIKLSKSVVVSNNQVPTVNRDDRNIGCGSSINSDQNNFPYNPHIDDDMTENARRPSSILAPVQVELPLPTYEEAVKNDVYVINARSK